MFENICTEGECLHWKCLKMFAHNSWITVLHPFPFSTAAGELSIKKCTESYYSATKKCPTTENYKSTVFGPKQCMALSRLLQHCFAVFCKRKRNVLHKMILSCNPLTQPSANNAVHKSYLREGVPPQKKLFFGYLSQMCFPTSGDTLLWENRRILVKPIIVLAQQSQPTHN